MVDFLIDHDHCQLRLVIFTHSLEHCLKLTNFCVNEGRYLPLSNAITINNDGVRQKLFLVVLKVRRYGLLHQNAEVDSQLLFLLHKQHLGEVGREIGVQGSHKAEARSVVANELMVNVNAD
jgi:hypothetical protein